MAKHFNIEIFLPPLF